MAYGVTEPYSILHSYTCHKTLENIIKTSNNYQDIIIVNDSHKKDDPEFSYIPPHMIEGTLDALPLRLYVDKIKTNKIQILKKSTLSAVEKDHNRSLIVGRYDAIHLAGFCASMDVWATLLDLVEAKQNVSVLADCIDDIFPKYKFDMIRQTKLMGIPTIGDECVESDSI